VAANGDFGIMNGSLLAPEMLRNWAELSLMSIQMRDLSLGFQLLLYFVKLRKERIPAVKIMPFSYKKSVRCPCMLLGEGHI